MEENKSSLNLLLIVAYSASRALDAGIACSSVGNIEITQKFKISITNY